jgi:hypothetical protein
MNKREIQRNQYIKFAVSKEEKEKFYEYAKYLNLAPTNLARNIILIEYEQNTLIKKYGQVLLKGYKQAAPFLNKEHEKKFEEHEKQTIIDFEEFERRKNLSRKDNILLEIEELQNELDNIND